MNVRLCWRYEPFFLGTALADLPFPSAQTIAPAALSTLPRPDTLILQRLRPLTSQSLISRRSCYCYPSTVRRNDGMCAPWDVRRTLCLDRRRIATQQAPTGSKRGDQNVPGAPHSLPVSLPQHPREDSGCCWAIGPLVPF